MASMAPRCARRRSGCWGSDAIARRGAETFYRFGMTRKLPTRRSNAELAEDALQKARLYRQRAREDERRAAGDFGLWVRALAARGDAAAADLCARWDNRTGSGAAAPRPSRTARAGGTAAEASAPHPGPPRRPRNPSEPIKAAQNWPVQGLELVSGQVRELVRQGRRLEARGLIVQAEESTGIPLVPAAHRPKWGLGPRAGEVVGPLQ